MLSFNILNKPQPLTKKTVIELGVYGPIGKWMVAKNWGAFTLPLPFLFVIFYWLTEETDEVPGETRVHEFQHVHQAEECSWFGQYWWRYLRSTMKDGGYRGNKFEVEAYAVEAKAVQEGLPRWAV